MWLSLGGYPEIKLDRITGQKKEFLTHYIVNDSGAIVEKYRKMHALDTRILVDEEGD